MNPLALLRHLRVTPFDTSTPQGRTDERYRRVAWSIVTNAIGKALGVAVMVLSVSLTVPYLGPERFGIWMTIASFAGMLSFLDLGVGNALTNHVAQRAVTGDPADLHQAISGGLGLLFVVGAVVGAGLYLVAAALPWSLLIKVTDPALLPEARQAAMLFAGLFGFNLFTTGIQRVFFGMQRAYEAHAANMLGSIAAIIGLWLATQRHAGIPTLLAVSLASQSGANLTLLRPLARRGQFSLTGIARAVASEYPQLGHQSGLFFVLQIGTMVVFGADTLIISSIAGVAQVAIFGVTQRLFQFIFQPLAIINAPLWGAYADAHSRGDRTFIRSTLRRSLSLTTALAVAGGLGLLLIGEWILGEWTDGAIAAPSLLLLAFAVWTVLTAAGNAFAMFLNGCKIVGPQVLTVILLIALSLPAKIGACYLWGNIGLVAATCIAYTVTMGWSYGMVFRKEIAEVLA